MSSAYDAGYRDGHNSVLQSVLPRELVERVVGVTDIAEDQLEEIRTALLSTIVVDAAQMAMKVDTIMSGDEKTLRTEILRDIRYEGGEE